MLICMTYCTHLDLQERVGDTTNIMLWSKPAHEQAAQNLAQHGYMPPVLLYGVGLYLTDLQHQRCADRSAGRQPCLQKSRLLPAPFATPCKQALQLYAGWF